MGTQPAEKPQLRFPSRKKLRPNHPKPLRLRLRSRPQAFLRDRFLQLILFRDLRCGRDDPAIAVNLQEVAVRNADGTAVHANENVHPVVIGPELFDLHMAQIDWRTKGEDYLFSD